ncbi:ImmA/IrrE family metallo-endopeptidase [Enterococcus sp. AZ103]|uniref:ImmA/IrrE family metallo-endopeptidase n=1 Tax=Enterococcus sp. AZ103 TaxID=2774628 RepID=UPI003F230439
MNTKNEVISQLHYLHKEFKTFDPFSLADVLDIEYKYLDTSSDFIGQSSNVLNEPLILLNSDLMDDPYRFVVMGHELYHAINHPDLTSYYSMGNYQKNKLEYEANKFSAALIINLYTERTGQKPMYFDDLKKEFNLEEEFEEFYF